MILYGDGARYVVAVLALAMPSPHPFVIETRDTIKEILHRLSAYNGAFRGSLRYRDYGLSIRSEVLILYKLRVVVSQVLVNGLILTQSHAADIEVIVPSMNTRGRASNKRTCP